MQDDRFDRAQRLIRRLRAHKAQLTRRDVIRAAFAFSASTIAMSLAPRPARAADDWDGPRASHPAIRARTGCRCGRASHRSRCNRTVAWNPT